MKSKKEIKSKKKKKKKTTHFLHHLRFFSSNGPNLIKFYYFMRNFSQDSSFLLDPTLDTSSEPHLESDATKASMSYLALKTWDTHVKW